MQNRNFLKIQESIQNLLPYLGIAIIVGVYLITAFVMGYFIHMRMESGILAGIVAFGTGIGTQLTRGYIVFNRQLTPGYLKRGMNSAILFALALTVYTLIEAYFLAGAYFVSIAGLVSSGFIVEYLYLTSLNIVTRQSIIGDERKLGEIQSLIQSEKAFYRFLDEIDSPTNATNTSKGEVDELKESVAKQSKLIDQLLNSIGNNGKSDFDFLDESEILERNGTI